MNVTVPPEFINMPWVMETSESLRRLTPWFLNWNTQKKTGWKYVLGTRRGKKILGNN